MVEHKSLELAYAGGRIEAGSSARWRRCSGTPGQPSGCRPARYSAVSAARGAVAQWVLGGQADEVGERLVVVVRRRERHRPLPLASSRSSSKRDPGAGRHPSRRNPRGGRATARGRHECLDASVGRSQRAWIPWSPVDDRSLSRSSRPIHKAITRPQYSRAIDGEDSTSRERGSAHRGRCRGGSASPRAGRPPHPSDPARLACRRSAAASRRWRSPRNATGVPSPLDTVSGPSTR